MFDIFYLTKPRKSQHKLFTLNCIQTSMHRFVYLLSLLQRLLITQITYHKTIKFMVEQLLHTPREQTQIFSTMNCT